MFETAIRRIEAREDLSMDQMSEAIGEIMAGACAEADVARFLLALRAKGETVAEVAGAAAALRRQMTRIRSGRTGLLDTCGTGGDGSMTFNISTAAALVAAAAGVPIAKHGNRRVSSRSGSADVLAVLGVNVNADVPVVEACLEELGICFCFAPLLHQAMRYVAPVRAKLGVATIFNILGPLSNPAGAEFQLLGVGRSELQPLLAEALALLGTERAIVVHGSDGLDEVTLAGPTHVTELGKRVSGTLGESSACGDPKGGFLTPSVMRHFTWTPAEFDLEPAELHTLTVAGPEESARQIQAVLAGQSGPARDIVVANAAAALWVVGRDASPRQCAGLAAEGIDTGAARELLARLVERTKRLCP